MLPQLEAILQAIENERHQLIAGYYTEVDQIFGMLFTMYAEELQYLAADDPQNATAEQIGLKFSELRPIMQALHDELSLGEYGEARELVIHLREGARTLFSLFEQYKSECATGPRYSEVPYTQELLRVCHHYLAGRLSLEAVQGRLDLFCQYHESLENQVSTLVPSPPEQQTFQERRPDLEEALALQLQAIEDLDHALEVHDKEAILEAMSLFSEAADALVEVYRQLQKADQEPVTVSCIRCGAQNSPEARICGSCGAVLPQAAGLGRVSTIALEEDGTAVASRESEQVKELQSLVDACLTGGSPAGLEKALAEYRLRVERNRRQFDRLDSPPAAIPEEHGALLARARETFAEGLGRVEEGLQLLSLGAAESDPAKLHQGMLEMRAGEELFREFQNEFQAAQKLS